MSSFAKITRRQFLSGLAATGFVAGAVPAIIPSGVLAAPGRPGANDRIAIAGIGVGRQGGGDINALARFKEVRLVAFADVNLERARAFATKYKGEAYQDYRKLLERKDVDAILTATPDHWRALVCIHACQAGKDVYAEKPMTLTVREGRLMTQAVRKYKRVFQTGSQQRSDPKELLGAELIRNGRIGKITRVTAYNYESPWEYNMPAESVPAELDWDMWCGPVEPVAYNLQGLYRPRAQPGWLSFRPFSGGEMTGWGAHGLDQIQRALGMDESGPLEVWTEGEQFAPPTYTAPELAARGNQLCASPKIFFRYAGDIIVELGKGPHGGAIFKGEKGTITIDRGKVASDPPELLREPIKDSEIHLYKSASHFQNWLDCIKSREKPVADVETGHRSSTVCHLGNIARWTGRRLKWDPARELFPEDAAANAFLDRPRRKPYTLPEEV